MLQVFQKALRGKLVGTAAITSLVSARVYATQAPTEAPYPHIVFNVNSGGNTNRSPREEGDIIFTVKGVATSGASAAAIASAIDAALHEADLTMDSPWNHYGCQQVGVFEYVENKDMRQYWHAGANYRLRAVQ